MPTYEFVCDACNGRSEFLLNVGETKRKCPKCQKSKLRRVFSSFGIADNYSPMHPRKGRGNNGAGRINPGDRGTINV